MKRKIKSPYQTLVLELFRSLADSNQVKSESEHIFFKYRYKNSSLRATRFEFNSSLNQNTTLPHQHHIL